jgi:cardiolipin synthase
VTWTLAAEYTLRILLAAAVLLQPGLGPMNRLAWLAIGFAFPLIGAPVYIFFGRTRLGALRRRRYREVCRIIAETELRRAVAGSRAPPPVPEEDKKIALLAERVGGNPVRADNRLALFGEASSFLASLERDIDAAQEHANLLFYIWVHDLAGQRIGEALVRAVQRGVRCRVLLDGIGSRPFLRSAACKELRDCGVEVVEALPARLWRLPLARVDLRNHRKIAVIDGRIGYTGSQNLAEASFALKPRFAPWVDVMMRIEGPAVHDLQGLFAQDWHMETGENPMELLTPQRTGPPGPDRRADTWVQIAGTGPASQNDAMRQLIQTAIHSAREELIITTPYFVPDSGTMSAIVAIARCGVDTTLVVPARNDSRLVAAASQSYFQDLLDAGVHLWEYEPGLLHAKTITVDRKLAIISTANMDRRSFDLNFEVSTVVYDSDFASHLRLLQRSYVSRSHAVDPDAHGRRSAWRRMGENAAALLHPVL